MSHYRPGAIRQKSYLSFLYGLTIAALLLSPAITAATLERPVVPARGLQQGLLHIEQFGRFAITVESEQGTALQLVDRMAGPGPLVGQAGGLDGRLDLFLDRGEYKLLTLAHEQGEGMATLGLHPFSELNAHPAPRLIEHRLVSESLADFQQRSYWLDIKARQTVVVEAAGRSLADMRLWRDGSWLVDAEPVHEALIPAPGQPLRGLSMVVTLEPGLYLLTAYGGRPLDWAETSVEQPFHLRLGIPRLGSVGRQHYTASPFGRDRWLVPPSANYYRLELPQAEQAAIEISRYSREQPLSGTRQYHASLDKKSIPPVAELTTGSSGDKWQLLTIKREAGKPYVLQHFRRDDTYTLSSSGRYWVSTIQSGHGEDAADATALVVHNPRNRSPAFHAADTIELDSNVGWQRRFNLLGENTLYLEVKERALYSIETEGVDAQLKIEPFLINPSRHYRAPSYRDRHWQQSLDAGFYTLTLRPDEGGRSRGKGIVTLNITAHGNVPSPSAAQTSVNLPVLVVSERDSYTVYSGQRAGVVSGLVVRPLPLDLSDPLPLTLAAGEAVEVAINLPEPGTLQFVAEDGQRTPFRIDDRAQDEAFTLAAGSYRARLENPGGQARSYSLRWLARSLNVDTPLPAVLPQSLNARPDFPLLQADKALFHKVARAQQITLNVSVQKPGLYRLESTGLLHTQGTLRTRVVPRLVRADANGIGRNFLIARYLREGDYQLTSQPQGKSQGDMGLQLKPTPLHDGGALEPGVVARYALEAGEGLFYRFSITEEADYRLRTLDLHGNARLRLEDADGWPLTTPGVDNELTHHLRPGDYRVVILPQAVGARVITLLEPVRGPGSFAGHGPHRISVQESLRHTWYEPKDGLARDPDRWQFTLPADATMRIALSEGMFGKLTLIGTNGFDPLPLYGNTPWHGNMPRGEYELTVTSQRPDNGRDYTLSLRSDELLIGTRRDLHAPGEYTIALGDEQPFDLGSFGNRDVRATLYDDQGRRLAANDDRPGDWNFLIATQLPRGNYRLSIDPVGAAQATTEVSLGAPQQHMEQVVGLPARFSVNDNLMHYYPLQTGGDGGLLLFGAYAADSAGLALERREGGEWRTLGSRTGSSILLAIPLDSESKREYRLRVWSASGRSLPISVNGLLLEADSEDEGELADGLSLAPVAAMPLPVAVASVRLEERGSLRLEHPDPLLEWGSSSSEVLSGNRRGYIEAAGDLLWLMRPLSGEDAVQVTAQRLRIGPGEELALMADPLRPASVNLADIPWLRGSSQLLLATSSAGQPGLRLDGVDSSPLFSASDQQGILLRHDNAAQRVSILGDVALPNSIPVRMSVHTFSREASLDARGGDNDFALAAQGILYLALPANQTALDLVLPAGVAAELVSDGETLRTLWSGRQPRRFQVALKADTVRLYNTNAGVRQASVGVRPLHAAVALDADQPLSGRFPGAGVWVVPLTLSERERREGRRVVLHGALDGTLAVQANGTVLRGDALRLTDNGVLYIPHASGDVVVWLVGEDGVTGLNPRRRVAAQPGNNLMVGESMGFTYHNDALGGVKLTCNEAVLVQVRNSQGREWLSLQPRGASLTLYLPAGESIVALYALDGSLDGDAHLQEVVVERLTEGMGAEVLLAPGESRLYHFALERALSIGLGVNASLDIVNSVLLNSAGMVLGEGLVQMHALEAGDYLLRVEAPADAQAVSVRPVLVGTDLPTDGAPPAEVVRDYLQQAGFKTGQ